ncbi:carbonic anhydrase-related protein 10 isoform X3 [Glossina fuscipes]|uniref:Carbonic anhydrase-related protein 10 isoform X3 n=1 Tax=Glossina fuscipes TaxID=7396 RepID=A0A9C5Z019_9MUSC|nr:carbonic anhydrase-related protein 10 isoform X3 [Glossina fuscipes]
MIFKCIIYIVVLSEFFRNIAQGRSLSGSNDSETIDRNSDNSVTIINMKNSTKADIVSTIDRDNYSELVWEVFGKSIIKPQLISNNTTKEETSSDNNPLELDRRTIWSIQIFGYNSQLYNNFSDALNRAQGIVGVSILLQLGDLSNAELRMLTDQLERIRYGGDEAFVKRLSIRGLLPDTDHYMTYDGSTTAPACHETVTWVVLNKPIYITKQQLYALRRLMQGSPDHPKAPLGNNYRPPQPLLHRPIRTNIDFKTPKINGKSACPTMYREVYYKATSWKQH